MKKSFIRIHFLLLLLPAFTIQPQGISVGIFPSGKYYEIYYADALAPQFSILKNFESSEWFGNIGNNFTLADIKVLNIPLQLSAAAAAFSTIIKVPGHIQVYTIDYLVDFYADYPASEKLTFRFLLGHLSAHYADDGVTELGFYPINYVRDYAGLHTQYRFSEAGIYLYGGFNYNFHNEPVDRQSVIQTGGAAERKISALVSVYAALDLKVKSEVNYGTTQSYQAGIKFNGDSGNLRLAFIHRRGFEERGQLFERKDVKNSIGIFLDL